MKIKRLHEDAILPRYSSTGASAFDVFGLEDVKWEFNGMCWNAIVETGWAFEISQEHGLFIFSRSGHGFNHLVHLGNAVGILDFDFRGQLLVRLICFTPNPPIIEKNKAIAQCVILHTPRQTFLEVEDLSKTERGVNGFGSTDKKLKIA